MPLFAHRRFVPLASLQDFIINEGLWGWNVRYYLAAIHYSQQDTLSLRVAYEVSHCFARKIARAQCNVVRTCYLVSRSFWKSIAEYTRC